MGKRGEMNGDGSDDYDDGSYEPEIVKKKPPSKPKSKSKNGSRSMSAKKRAAQMDEYYAPPHSSSYSAPPQHHSPSLHQFALPMPIGSTGAPGSVTGSEAPYASTSAYVLPAAPAIPVPQRVEGQIVSVRMADGKVFELDIHEAALKHAESLTTLDASRPAKRQRTDDGEDQKPSLQTPQEVLSEIITEAASLAQPVDPIQHAHEKRLGALADPQPVHDAVLKTIGTGESIPDSLKNLLPVGPPSTISGPFVIPAGANDRLAVDGSAFAPVLNGPVDRSALPADASLAVYYVVYERTVTVQPQQIYDASSGVYIPIQPFYTSDSGITSALPPHVYAVATVPESVRGQWRGQNGKGKDRPTLAEVRDAGKEAPWPKDIDLSKRQRAPRRCQVCQSFECKGRGGRKFCQHYDPETDGLRAGAIIDPPPAPAPLQPSPSPSPVVLPPVPAMAQPMPPAVVAPPAPTAEETAQTQQIQAILDQQAATGDFSFDAEQMGDLNGYGDDVEEEEGGVLQLGDLV